MLQCPWSSQEPGKRQPEQRDSVPAAACESHSAAGVLGLRAQLCVMLCAKQRLFTVQPSTALLLFVTHTVGSLSQCRANSRLLTVQRCCQLEPAGQNLGLGSAGAGGSRGSAAVIGSRCQLWAVLAFRHGSPYPLAQEGPGTAVGSWQCPHSPAGTNELTGIFLSLVITMESHFLGHLPTATPPALTGGHTLGWLLPGGQAACPLCKTGAGKRPWDAMQKNLLATGTAPQGPQGS